MAKTAQEKLIIKKVVARPLLRQCLSFAETVPQPAPDLNARSWLYLLLTLLWLSCCLKLHADSCRLFICRLSLSAGPGLPVPSFLPQASGTGPKGSGIKYLKAPSGALPCLSIFPALYS